MEKDKKISIGLALLALLMILIIALISFRGQGTYDKVSEKPEMTDKMEAQKEVIFSEEIEEESFVYAEKMPDIFGKSAEVLYQEAFVCTQEETEQIHYYIKDGTLFLDEYAETGNFDEEGVAIYEWRRDQKIADNVVYVDYDSYSYTNNAIYITKENELAGTGKYSEISLDNVKFARAYAGQLIALKTDGSLWCRGQSYSLSDGRMLQYQDWQQVLTDVVYASVGHYLYMAITKNGSLYMWGDNTYGQFGDGTLLREESKLLPDVYFYPEPVKVADGIKMVWSGKPGEQYSAEMGGEIPMRTYMLTQEDEMYVCGEAVDEEIRTFYYFGELGPVEEGYDINATGKLYQVEYVE